MAPLLRRLAPLSAGLVVALGAAACGGGTNTSSSAHSTEHVTLHLGYFPNLTHAPALVGVDKSLFTSALGSNVTLKTATFNAGPAVVEALFSGAIDIAYVGPNPAITAYTKSHGQAIRVIAGATSGGAALVVSSKIHSAADLRGKKIATPQLGNTQDVALRYWLKQHGFATDPQGGGDVHIVPQDNSQTLQTFAAGQIDGAWVPEPYATRLVHDGDGHVLVDEGSLWPGGKFVTTQVVVRTKFLKEHADVVRNFLKGHLRAVQLCQTDPAAAQQAVNDQLRQLTGRALKPGVLAAAWQHLTFTVDPISTSLRADAEHAKSVGFSTSTKLDGIYDMSLLNQVLQSSGQPAVSAA